MPTHGLPRTPERRLQDWHKHCKNDCPVKLCSCIDVCECGHFRSQHDFDYATDTGSSYGACEAQTSDFGHTCPCDKFTHDEEDY